MFMELEGLEAKRAECLVKSLFRNRRERGQNARNRPVRQKHNAKGKRETKRE